MGKKPNPEMSGALNILQTLQLVQRYSVGIRPPLHHLHGGKASLCLCLTN
jgi:hypothetical protein